MSRLIDADAIITALLYDEEHEETQEVKMSIADFLDSHTVEGSWQNGGWISVKDRLPKQNGLYLVYDGEYLGSAEYEKGRMDSEWTDNYEEYLDLEVTHWMPLPEPPKEDA